MKLIIWFIILLIYTPLLPSVNAGELIELNLRGGISHKALFYKSDGTRAAILAHQTGASMESWEKFAKFLADHGVMSISLSSTTPDDVLAAVDYLKRKQYKDLTLIGASAGAGAITQAMTTEAFPPVKYVVLLSPSWCSEMQSDQILKLIILARQDFYKSRAEATFKEASEPKKLIELDGSEHGQDLLTGEHSSRVLSEILNFLHL